MQPFNLRTCYPSVVGQEDVLAQHIRAALAGGGADLSAAHPPQGREEDLSSLSADLVRSKSGNLIVTCSGQSALAACVEVLCADAQKSIAVEEWTFPLALSALRRISATIVPMPMDEDGLLPDGLERAAISGVKVLYTMPTVHNPLGLTMSLERRREIVSIARRHDMMIIEDDAYAYLGADELPALQMLAPERTFQLFSLSKIVSLSARTGAIVVPPPYLAAVASQLRIAGSMANPIMASALAGLARAGGINTLIRQKRAEGAERLALAREILQGPFQAHPNGWFLVLDLPHGADGARLAAELERNGILVSNGQEYRSGEPVQGRIRISLGGEVNKERLADGLEALQKLL